VAAEDTGDLQTSAECLVEEHPGLELANEQEAREERDGREHERPHQDLIAPGERLHRLPQPDCLDDRLDHLGNQKHAPSGRHEGEDSDEDVKDCHVSDCC